MLTLLAGCTPLPPEPAAPAAPPKPASTLEGEAMIERFFQRVSEEDYEGAVDEVIRLEDYEESQRDDADHLRKRLLDGLKQVGAKMGDLKKRAIVSQRDFDGSVFYQSCLAVYRPNIIWFEMTLRNNGERWVLSDFVLSPDVPTKIRRIMGDSPGP